MSSFPFGPFLGATRSSDEQLMGWSERTLRPAFCTLCDSGPMRRALAHLLRGCPAVSTWRSVIFPLSGRLQNHFWCSWTWTATDREREREK